MKTKVMIAAVLMLICSMGIQSAVIKGNGKVATRTIQVSEYDQIEVGVSMNGNLFSLLNGKSASPVFNYTQTNGGASLQITVDENLFDALEITSDGSRLKIKAKGKDQITPTQFIIKGSSKNLSKISFAGSCDFVLQGALNTESLEIASSGSSDIIMKQPVSITKCKASFSGSSDWVADNLTCSSLELALSGSSDASLSGKADKASFSASGSSDVNAYGFIVNELECGASGSSDMNVNATANLKVSASGGSDIRYKGNADVKSSASGGSSIKAAK